MVWIEVCGFERRGLIGPDGPEDEADCGGEAAARVYGGGVEGQWNLTARGEEWEGEGKDVMMKMVLSTVTVLVTVMVVIRVVERRYAAG